MNAPAILEARAQWIAEGANPLSKMRQLAEEHFVQIVEWLLAPIAAHKVVDMARAEFGLPASALPGKTALYEFWESFSRYWLMAWRRQSARDAKAVREEIARSPGEWEQPVLDMVQQRAFELLSHPTSDPRDLKGLITLLLKQRDQDLKSEQIDLARRKMALLEQQSSDARKTLRNEALTPEQREQRMKEIFGLA